MLSKSVLRRVLLPLALVIGVFAVSAPGAQALYEHHYGGYVMGPGFGTDMGIRSDYTGNIAAYLGAGQVKVCQKTEDFTTLSKHEGCGINSVGNALNLQPYAGHTMKPWVFNQSCCAHTIHGWAYTTNP